MSDDNARSIESLGDKASVQCFLRISIGGEVLPQDIVIELDTLNRPKTTRSFLSLCTTSGGNANNSNDDNDSAIRTSKRSPQPTYRGCEFHRIVPGLCVQAGDWERFDGTGGYSPLYGRNWDDEGASPTPGAFATKSNNNNKSSRVNKHDREGIVSMANSGRANTNGSQFFVTLKPTPHLDGKHVVFGRVLSGMESVRKMETVERGEKDRPVSLQRIVIEDCGLLPEQPKPSPEEDRKHRGDHREKNGGETRRSKSKKHKREKESDRRDRKRHDRKRRRHKHRRGGGSSESRGSDGDGDGDSDSDSDSSSNSDRKERHRRHRHSRKYHKRKYRRKKHEKDYDSSDGDGSSPRSSGTGDRDDGRRGRARQRRRRSPSDEVEKDAGSRTKKERTTRRRNDEKRRSKSSRR
mmetsp:Transcript_12409/g.26264  ORF Transcript_12409/g.26264 Transcript_12409/m.26264 type:complete len:408 (-) Transcript_12409:386-1609(-)|eukprot:CAMPEP_0201235228 /NCGR_PEP_ID=MMETSP0852-20130820/6887_1 /ASSEMBLY_ACC=CAM_ASM_000632 /TAXON_ID=183588 /ORGANISM="Pseudo-nitzschia fraudulenta, Strain WWA7" /LENGTH=407 /DNA_ID=CAMNT_0047528783 /DNA_START=95 /DNA_END=1318 /DNA_ORIENTATION=+